LQVFLSHFIYVVTESRFKPLYFSQIFSFKLPINVQSWSLRTL